MCHKKLSVLYAVSLSTFLKGKKFKTSRVNFVYSTYYGLIQWHKLVVQWAIFFSCKITSKERGEIEAYVHKKTYATTTYTRRQHVLSASNNPRSRARSTVHIVSLFSQYTVVCQLTHKSKIVSKKCGMMKRPIT